MFRFACGLAAMARPDLSGFGGAQTRGRIHGAQPIDKFCSAARKELAQSIRLKISQQH